MKNTLTLLLLLLSFRSFACLNEYRTLLSGEVVETEETSGKVRARNIDRVELRKKSQQLLASYQKTGAIDDLSDYAAALVYLGEYQEAKQIYQKIEKQKPGLYTTASNLGTIYELMGKPDSALVWIKKSVKLNPASHKGSEWIHIAILEFKLKNASDFTRSILNLNFGSEAIPGNPNRYDLEKLQGHIRHQLQERVTFIKPKDLIVGNIYFDYGNCLALTTDVQAALESYEAAKEYGFESELMNLRIQELQTLANKAKVRQATIGFIKEHVSWLFFSAIGVILSGIGLVTYTILRKKKNKQAAKRTNV